MEKTMIGRTLSALVPSTNDEDRVKLIVSIILDWAVIMPIFVVTGTLTYGRYTIGHSHAFAVNAKLAWFLQELPSFVVPLFIIIGRDNVSPFSPGFVLLFMFMLHYFHRTFIYSFKIQGGKPTTLLFLMLATPFCSANGYMQAVYHLDIAHYPTSWLISWNFFLGTFFYALGMYTNIRCDNILRKLRKPGETGYKIPEGFLFDYVTGGNYFGEAMEWMGWALASWSLPALAFCIFATVFVGSRSYVHHNWYLKQFQSYPKNRKIYIPFIW